MTTEITPLTNSSTRLTPNNPYYGNDTGVQHFYTRRKKEQQLQCLTYVFVIAIFIMAMVVTVSYSINKSDPMVESPINPETVPPSSPPLKSAWTPNLRMTEESSSIPLTSVEWSEAVQAGQEAITSRIRANTLSTPLAAPSPDSRHQYAVRTSLRAGELALGGIGELAATRYVQMSRLKLGEPTSMGSYFKNIWLPEDTCKEFSEVTCPPSKYRNYDGTCNHPRNYGAALTPFIRKLPADYADDIESPRIGKNGKNLPSAREISLKVHPPAPSSNPAFTVMLAVFGQFLDHDITATAISQGTNGSSLSCCPIMADQHPECFPVKVGPGDPVFDSAGRDCMEFVRSAPAPQCKIGPREQLNQVTSFIDGSVIYGPDHQTSQGLRAGLGGSLRMFKTPDNRTLLPQSTDPNDGCNREAESARGRYCFAAGDGRANENLHLTTMHLLWARQHNRIAEELSRVNPVWSDERIYQETRRIIGAQLQHVTYNEFLPIVLGETEVRLRKLRPLSSGFRPRDETSTVNPAIANSFAAAAFRFAHTLLPGLMRVTDSSKATFSYVELHRMLFNPYSLYSKGGMESSLTTATSNSIQRTTTHVTSQLTNHLFEDPLSNATIPCGLDLVSLNIQRGRDHGLPGYTAWRRQCGLGDAKTFDDLRGEMDNDALDQISQFYDHVDDIDLYTGALAEVNNGDGLIGPTFKCLISDQFTRLQQGDRFWYEGSGEPQSFTEGQLKEIRKTSLAKLICDCSDEINHIQPEVMRSINPTNPMLSCEDINGVDLSLWKDASFPILKAPPATPETWLNFTTEINQTVKEIVDFFGKTKPAPGSPDWLTFNDWINKSFADIHNDLAALHPKSPPTLNLRPESGGKKTDGILLGLMTPAMTYTQWMTFKTDVKRNLADALANATGIPSAEQREELAKRMKTEINDIKGKIALMKGAKPNLGDAKLPEDEADSPDWLALKNDLVSAINDAIDRIQSDAPPPNDPAWATYAAKIKKQFASMKYYIPVPMNKKTPKNPLFAGYSEKDTKGPTNIFAQFQQPTLGKQLAKKLPEDPAIAALWSNFRDTLNKSISDSVAKVAGKNLKPDDPVWMTFGQSIMKDFSSFKDQFATVKVKSLQAAEPTSDPKVVAFWDDFRSSLNNSLDNALAGVTSKTPPAGDPAWATFGAKIMDNFSMFKDKFATLHPKPLKPQEKAVGTDPLVPFDWYNFKTDIVNSVTDIVGNINEDMPPAGSPAWMTFRDGIMKGFAKIPKKKPVKPSAAIPIQKVTTDDKTFDWVALKKEINDIVTNLMNKKSIPGTIEMAIDQKSPKLEELQFTVLMKDWTDFKAKLNESVVNAIASMKSKVSPPPGDPSWITFRDSIKDEFVGLKTDIASLKTNTFSTIPKVSLAKVQKNAPVVENVPDFSSDLFSLQATNFGDSKKTIVGLKATSTPLIPAADWIAFKQEIKGSVMNVVNSLNGTDVLEWTKIKDSVKKSFADLRNEIVSLKNSTVVP